MGKIQKVYTKEFQEEAVRLVHTSGKPIAQMAGISWVSPTVRFMGGARSWLSTGKKPSQAKDIRRTSFARKPSPQARKRGVTPGA